MTAASELFAKWFAFREEKPHDSKPQAPKADSTATVAKKQPEIRKIARKAPAVKKHTTKRPATSKTSGSISPRVAPHRLNHKNLLHQQLRKSGLSSESEATDMSARSDATNRPKITKNSDEAMKQGLLNMLDLDLDEDELRAAMYLVY